MPNNTEELPSLVYEGRARLERQSLQRRLSIIHQLARILLIIAILFTFVNIWTLFSTAGATAWFNLAAGLIGFVCYLFSYLLSTPKAASSSANLSSYLLIVGLVVALSAVLILPGSAQVALAGFFLVPVQVVLTELRQRRAIFTMSIAGLIQAGFAVYQTLTANTANAWGIVFGWVAIYSLLAFSIYIVTNRLGQAVGLSEQQAEQLGQLLSTLQNTTGFCVTLSSNLSSVTAELSATSRQHSASSHEQTAALTQITIGLEELSETAGQIANGAVETSRLVNEMLLIVNVMQQTGSLVNTTVEEGTAAVEETVTSVQAVRDRIERLGERLVYLTAQNRKVGAIIDIIDEIADETHLLALNASIEAAGSSSIQEQSLVRLRGDRFGVIAEEIKRLSDRSRKATGEVRTTVSTIQEAVAAAVLVAEESKKETAIAVGRSQVAGTVIRRLNEVIRDNRSRTQNIFSAFNTIRDRAEEISSATREQRSANQQILTTMRMVTDMASQSAIAVSHLSSTAEQINTQVVELNDLLDTASRPAERPTEGPAESRAELASLLVA